MRLEPTFGVWCLILLLNWVFSTVIFVVCNFLFAGKLCYPYRTNKQVHKSSSEKIIVVHHQVSHFFEISGLKLTKEIITVEFQELYILLQIFIETLVNSKNEQTGGACTGAGLPGWKPRFDHLVSGWPQASYLIFLLLFSYL